MRRNACACALFLSLVLALPSLADPGIQQTEPVQPMPGTKLLVGVPLVQQTTDYTCGPATMSSVMAYYGQDFDETTLAKELGTDPKTGTDELRMADFANSRGVPARVAKNQTLKDLKEAVEKGQAVIPLIQAWRGHRRERPDPPVKQWPEVWDAGHYVVLVGLDANNVFFVDPSLAGRRGYIPVQEFLDRWHDIAANGQKEQHSAIYFEGTPKPLHPWAKID